MNRKIPATPEHGNPEAIRCDHRVGLLCLGGVEGSERVTPIPVLKECILNGGTVDSAQRSCTEHTRYTHHVERVKCLLGTTSEARRQVPQLAQAGDGRASRLNRVPGGLRTRIA